MTGWVTGWLAPDALLSLFGCFFYLYSLLLVLPSLAPTLPLAIHLFIRCYRHSFTELNTCSKNKGHTPEK